MRSLINFLLLVISAGPVFCQPGTLDPTFGNGGSVLRQLSGSNDEGRAIAIQADGKIVVACYTPTGAGDIVLLRYTPDGEPDNSFGIEGLVNISFGTGLDQVNAMKIQPDGKIVIAGYSQIGGQNLIALARLDGNGNLDTSFSSDGLATFAITLTSLTSSCTDQFGQDLTLRPDGRMVVTGFCQTNNTSDWIVALGLTSEGELDNGGFNAPRGQHIRDIGLDAQNDQGWACVLRADGSFVQAGMSVGPTGFDYVLAKFGADGEYSPFDYTRTDMGSSSDLATSIVDMPGGRLVLVGITDGGWGLAGYTAAGSGDGSFGTNARVILPVGSFSNSVGQAILHPWDKILVVGTSSNSSNDSHLTIVRFLYNGDLDPTFDGDGIVRTLIEGGVAKANCVALQADGKIVVAGWARSGTNNAVMVARFENDFSTGQQFGHLATSDLSVFPVPCFQTLTIGGTRAGGTLVVRDATGRIVLTGTTTQERTSLGTEALAMGTYTVHIGSSVLRVVKQ